MNRVKTFLVQPPSTARNRFATTGVPALRRQPLSWVRFAWDLSVLAETPAALPPHYQISRATAEDDSGLRKVFSSSFMLDPVWSPAIGEVMGKVQAWLDGALESDDRICLALRHGARIIGAAMLQTRADAEDQLAPGPTISLEYRNRGLGTLLLEHSLHALRSAGFSRVTGITRDISPAAKFLYRKFGGVSAPAEFAVLAAA